MKYQSLKLLIGLTFLNLTACLPITIVKIGGPSPTPSPTPSPSGSIPIKSEIAEYKDQTFYCEPLVIPDKPKLLYPSDLAVTPDGQTIYVINGECPGITRSRIGWSTKIPNCHESDSTYLNRRFIYKLSTKNLRLEIFKIQGQPPLSCSLGNNLDIDTKGSLYVTDEINQGIYQLNEQVSKRLLLIDEAAKGADTEPIYPPPVEKRLFYFGEPYNLHVFQDALLFGLNAFATYSEYQVRLLNLTNKNMQVVLDETYDFNSVPQFMPAYSNNRPYVLSGSSITQLELPYPEKFDSTAHSPSLLIHQISSDSVISDFTVNQNGDFYVSDVGNHVIWKIRFDDAFKQADVQILAGGGHAGYQDGQGDQALFNVPAALSLDMAGNVYVADMGNNAIRKITPDGTVTTFYAEKSD